MITDAIVLAGGFGTRLKKVTLDIPKPMVDINGYPFLSYLLNNLARQQVKTVILSVGYQYEMIREYFGERYKSLIVKYSIEEVPLGTGGGIKKSIDLISQEEVFVLNGDTLFEIDLEAFYRFHQTKQASLTIALKQMKDIERYGTVEIDGSNRIIGFKEKQFQHNAYINGGIYVVSRNVFTSLDLPEQFSFEKDLMEKYYEHNDFYGSAIDNYFIDVGIPQDYERAKKEFKRFTH